MPLKQIADEALEDAPSIAHVVVVRRTGAPVAFREGREHWWHRLMADAPIACKAEKDEGGGPALHPVHLRTAPGSQGDPPHHRGLSRRRLRDLEVDLLDVTDVYWCTADVGWVTGHTYLVHCLLANGATCVMLVPRVCPTRPRAAASGT